MKEIYGKVMKLIKRQDDLKLILEDNKSFLKPGRYKTTVKGKEIIYQEDEKTVNFIKKNVDHISRKTSFIVNFKLMVKDFLLNTIKIHLKDATFHNEFNGSLAMITRNNELKIFDFKKKEVLNLLKDEKKYNLIKNSYYNFKEYFNIPIKSFNDEKLIYIEDYIEFKPYPQWSDKEKEEIIEEIFEGYIRYVNNYDKSKLEYISLVTMVMEFTNKIEDKSLVDEILKHIDYDKTLSSKFPRLWLHGDLDFHNLLLSANKGYVIDWEFNKKFIFLYDILNIFMVEYIYQNDESYLIEFLKGSYDGYLKKMFNSMDLEYKTYEKKEYVCIFIIERTMEWELMYNPLNINGFLNKSIDLLNRIDELQIGVER